MGLSQLCLPIPLFLSIDRAIHSPHSRRYISSRTRGWSQNAWLPVLVFSHARSHALPGFVITRVVHHAFEVRFMQFPSRALESSSIFASPFPVAALSPVLHGAPDYERACKAPAR